MMNKPIGLMFHGPVTFKNSDLRGVSLQYSTFENTVDWSGAQLGGATWMDEKKCKDESVGTCL